MSYRVTTEIEHNPEVLAEERRILGRFVLATNDLELPADELLANYKGQGAVERGFRFLKDKSFRVAEVFLKKISRIQATGDGRGALPVHLRTHGVPAATRIGANRRDGDQPDEEADATTNDEVGVLPVLEGTGVCGGRGGEEGETGGEPE